MNENQIQLQAAPKMELSQDRVCVQKKLEALIQSGIACTNMAEGIERALLTAQCMDDFRAALTDEAMQPFMRLQNSPLGFRTDGTYKVDAVRDALINAFMVGLTPCGNQWNIIGGRMYVTKEGFTFLLKKMGVKYSITPSVPKFFEQEAVVHVKIQWSLKDEDPNKLNVHEMDIPIRVNKGMGSDAVLGKCDRKAKSWLYNNIFQNCSLPDGDVFSQDSYQPRNDMRNVNTVERKSPQQGQLPPPNQQYQQGGYQQNRNYQNRVPQQPMNRNNQPQF